MRVTDTENLQLNTKINVITKRVEETRKDMVVVGINPTVTWNKNLFQIKTDKSERF